MRLRGTHAAGMGSTAPWLCLMSLWAILGFHPPADPRPLKCSTPRAAQEAVLPYEQDNDEIWGDGQRVVIWVEGRAKPAQALDAQRRILSLQPEPVAVAPDTVVSMRALLIGADGLASDVTRSPHLRWHSGSPWRAHFCGPPGELCLWPAPGTTEGRRRVRMPTARYGLVDVFAQYTTTSGAIVGNVIYLDIADECAP